MVVVLPGGLMNNLSEGVTLENYGVGGNWVLSPIGHIKCDLIKNCSTFKLVFLNKFYRELSRNIY